MNKYTKQEERLRAIKQHEAALKRIFSVQMEGFGLYPALRRLERKAYRAVTAYTNGDIDEKRLDAVLTDIEKRLDVILRYRQKNIPVFINRDPRGHALKIKADWVKNNAPDIMTDWGLNGLIAPDI